MTIQLVENEERSQFFRRMIARKIGCKEEEDFMNREEVKLKGGGNFKKNRKVVDLIMREKLRDNLKLGEKIRKQRSRLITSIKNTLGPNSRPSRGIMRSMNDTASTTRQKSRIKFRKKEKFLATKYGNQEEFDTMAGLSEVDRKKYGKARIFQEPCNITPIAGTDPAVVDDDENEVKLSKDEKSLLVLGPKYCTYNALTEESFEVELEQCIVKLKWEMMGNDVKNKKNESLCDIAINAILDDDEKRECEEYFEVLEGKQRVIYDIENNSLVFRRRRATDMKGNARVNLTRKARDFDTEAK